jgi:hypothetical protein
MNVWVVIHVAFLFYVFADVTVIVTFDDTRIRPTEADNPSRHDINFMTWISFVKSRTDLDWVFYVNQNCSHVRSFVPVRCYLISKDMLTFEYKVPILSRLLSHARASTRQRYIMYVNEGVIFFGDIHQIIQAVRSQTKKPHIFLTSQAVGVNLLQSVNLLHPCDEYTVRSMKRILTPFPNWACELFIIDRASPMIKAMPSFLVGRIRWDNWVLQYAAVMQSITAVDISEAFDVIHLQHGESSDGSDMSAFRARGSAYNKQLCQAAGGHLYGNMECVPYVLSNNVLSDQSERCRQLSWFDENSFRKLQTFYTNM